MIVRFLNQKGVRMHNIMLDGVLDTSPPHHRCHAAVKIGDVNYGGPAELGETSQFQISNIQTRARNAFTLGAPLADSMISNVLLLRDPEEEEEGKEGVLVGYHGGKHEMRNVFFQNCQVIDLKK